MARRAAEAVWRAVRAETGAGRAAGRDRELLRRVVAARRRAGRESAAAVPEAVPPADRMTVREFLTALDEELDRLSARYREPLVLCYLEGLTRDEAARRLNIPAGTLKIRLERGRKR